MRAEEKWQSLLAPAEINRNTDSEDYYNTCVTQGNPISSISATGIA